MGGLRYFLIHPHVPPIHPLSRYFPSPLSCLGRFLDSLRLSRVSFPPMAAFQSDVPSVSVHPHGSRRYGAVSGGSLGNWHLPLWLVPNRSSSTSFVCSVLCLLYAFSCGPAYGLSRSRFHARLFWACSWAASFPPPPQVPKSPLMLIPVGVNQFGRKEQSKGTALNHSVPPLLDALLFISSKMAALIWRCSFTRAKARWLHQRCLSLYNSSHGFDETKIKEKLAQLSGGSIDLRKGENGIAELCINNPSRMNAFTGTMMIQLEERISELESWQDGKGLIVYGAGNNFCTGSDLNAVKAISSPKEGIMMCMLMQNTLTRMQRLPLISVALIQGKAMGGGSELCTACDFRLIDHLT
ncbi:ethylmalonyl- decarboxylase isoform X1 [Pelobates cultripes]|uniref:Ethylmalonyl-CoA decarboxylase n=1 Tax=Pelobates cultripes TaxID=61616 RepID=A0AAD1VSB1_PELCU|nr:ethylmalonyl- decarboxylase isoform X1 [Pelobates cultripes]